MHGVEVLFIALAFLFYVVRAVFRGVRSLARWVRRVTGPRPVEQVVEQVTAPQPSQPARVVRPRPEAGARRPEAGGPAVAGAATSPQFRAQVARLESEEEARRPAPGPTEGRAAPAPARLPAGPDDLLRAVIMQEVLAKPLSQRRRAPRPTPPQQ